MRQRCRNGKLCALGYAFVTSLPDWQVTRGRRVQVASFVDAVMPLVQPGALIAGFYWVANKTSQTTEARISASEKSTEAQISAIKESTATQARLAGAAGAGGRWKVLFVHPVCTLSPAPHRLRRSRRARTSVSLPSRSRQQLRRGWQALPAQALPAQALAGAFRPSRY